MSANYEKAKDQKDLRKVLSTSDLENWFDIYVDRKGNKAYNVNQTVRFDVNPKSMPTYSCEGEAFWPLVSYRIYGTTRLAWMLMKINGVGPDDVFEPVRPGREVMYVPEENVHVVIKALNGYNRS